MSTGTAPALSAAEARAIARDAYVYGFPLVDSYRIQHAYFVDRSSPEFKAPWNLVSNTARVFTPDDKAIQTPNSDTPYSSIGADLRAEPLVITVPPVEKTATSRRSSSTSTPSTSRTWAAVPRATTAARSCWRGPAGRERRRTASRR